MNTYLYIWGDKIGYKHNEHLQHTPKQVGYLKEGFCVIILFGDVLMT